MTSPTIPARQKPIDGRYVEEQPVRMCSDCRWCGSGWFLLIPEHRRCHHPLVIAADARFSPAGDGKAQVGIERQFSIGPCGPAGKLWNTDAKGNAR